MVLELTGSLRSMRLIFVQSSGLAGDDLVKALEGLGLDEGGEGGDNDGNILPIMQSIMQNLLSKDVLYPSLKEITSKVCLVFDTGILILPVCVHSSCCVCLHSIQSGWKPTSQPSALRTTSVSSSRLRLWERSVSSLRTRKRRQQIKSERLSASWI